MPYNIEHRGSSYAVVDDGGKVVGTHDTKEEAVNQQRALYANVPDATEKQSPCWEGYVQRGMKPGKDGQPVPNCVPATTKVYDGCGCEECLKEDITCSECDACDKSMDKAEGSYTPTSGMKAAARRH